MQGFCKADVAFAHRRRPSLIRRNLMDLSCARHWEHTSQHHQKLDESRDMKLQRQLHQDGGDVIHALGDEPVVVSACSGWGEFFRNCKL